MIDFLKDFLRDSGIVFSITKRRWIHNKSQRRRLLENMYTTVAFQQNILFTFLQ